MKCLRFITISLTVLLLASCSQYYAKTSDLNQRITDWLINNEYAQIENTLKYLSKGHSDYKKIISRKKHINKKKKSFINKTIKSAKKLQKKEKWQQALTLYVQALSKAPDNKKLTKARNKLLAERNSQVNELRKDMLLRRANALIQYQPIYEKLKRLIPEDSNAKSDISFYENQIADIAEKLTDCGNQELKNKMYTLAEECFQLSYSLVKSKEKLALLKKTRKISTSRDQQRRSNDLLESYHQAYNSGDFPKARYYLDSLIALNPKHEQIKELKTQLDRDINTKIEKGIIKGRDLYTLGKIDQAVKTWQALLKIDPKNKELAKLIARGKKVSKKIKTLESTGR